MKESTWSPKGAFKVSNNSRSIRLRERRLCSPLLGLSFLMMIRESFFRKSIRSWTQMEMESSDQRKFNWVSVKFLENRFLFKKLNRSWKTWIRMIMGTSILKTSSWVQLTSPLNHSQVISKEPRISSLTTCQIVSMFKPLLICFAMTRWSKITSSTNSWNNLMTKILQTLTRSSMLLISSISSSPILATKRSIWQMSIQRLTNGWEKHIKSTTQTRFSKTDEL